MNDKLDVLHLNAPCSDVMESKSEGHDSAVGVTPFMHKHPHYQHLLSPVALSGSNVGRRRSLAFPLTPRATYSSIHFQLDTPPGSVSIDSTQYSQGAATTVESMGTRLLHASLQSQPSDLVDPKISMFSSGLLEMKRRPSFLFDTHLAPMTLSDMNLHRDNPMHTLTSTPADAEAEANLSGLLKDADTMIEAFSETGKVIDPLCGKDVQTENCQELPPSVLTNDPSVSGELSLVNQRLVDITPKRVMKDHLFDAELQQQLASFQMQTLDVMSESNGKDVKQAVPTVVVTKTADDSMETAAAVIDQAILHHEQEKRRSSHDREAASTLAQLQYQFIANHPSHSHQNLPSLQSLPQSYHNVPQHLSTHGYPTPYHQGIVSSTPLNHSSVPSYLFPSMNSMRRGSGASIYNDVTDPHLESVPLTASSPYSEVYADHVRRLSAAMPAPLPYQTPQQAAIAAQLEHQRRFSLVGISSEADVARRVSLVNSQSQVNAAAAAVFTTDAPSTNLSNPFNAHQNYPPARLTPPLSPLPSEQRLDSSQNVSSLPGTSFSQNMSTKKPRVSLSETDALHSEESEDSARNHPCPLCGRRFARRYNMTQHMKIHNTHRVKEHQCQICDQRFYRSADLNRHVKTHENRSLYVSPCGKKFSRQDAIDRHKKKTACQLCNAPDAPPPKKIDL